jgi:tetratricopeptide (TPR) repeat protein
LSQCHLPWLLILDNADEPDLDIPNFIPAGGMGHILITTRNPNVSIYATAGELRFRGMDPEEAISLLLKSAYPYDHVEDCNSQKRSLAQSIAAELGYLAIALDQAGSTIRRKIYTIERYLHFYLGYRHRILNSSKHISVDEANIITTWEIPFRRIEQRQFVEHKDAVALLHILAFLHFESIPERLFHVSWISSEGDPLPDVQLPDLLQLDSSQSEAAQARLRRAIGVLFDYSIIDHDADRETCSLHPVVHKWARTRLTDEKTVSYWLDCTMKLLVRCISPNLEASGRSFRRRLLPHVDSCVQILNICSPSFPNSKQRADQVERFAWVYAENGLWRSALTLQHKVIKYRSGALGKVHNETLRAQRSLSQIYWNLFEVESAINIQKQILITRWWSRPSLACWTSPWRPDHISYCIALDDLTQTLWLAGLRDLSKRVGERAVSGLLRRIGPEDPRTLNAMFNLARTYLHLGDLDKSHKMLVLVLGKRKKLFGLQHPDTLMTRNELGMSFCARKQRLAVAERLVTNVLEARKQVLGEEHAYTLWSANDLSKVLCERGNPSKAAKMLEDLIPVVERTLGERHVGMNMTKGNLARAYVLCERWNNAQELLRQMLAVIKEDHPDWIHSMYGYAHVQIQLGRLNEAEINCNRMLDKIVETKTLARENPRTSKIVEQLARIYRDTGRSKQISILKARFPSLDEAYVKKDSVMQPTRSAQSK